MTPDIENNPLVEALKERLKVWQDRLLDLSNRNQSINFKEYKTSTFKIESPDYKTLVEKVFIDGDSLIPTIEKDDSLAKNEILIFTEASKPETPFLNLSRLFKSSKEDMGVNVVHMAIGFLEWYESDSSDIPVKSPLILIPVKVIRSITEDIYQLPFRLSLEEDELKVNKVFESSLKDNDGKVVKFVLAENFSSKDGNNCKKVKFNEPLRLSNIDEGTEVTLDLCKINENYELSAINLTK